jgi:histidine ammonia-lyase
MHPNTFISDGLNLNPYELVRIARAPIDPATLSPALRVGLSEEAIACVHASRAIVDDIVARGELVYGITTGFGAFKDRVIPAEELAQLQVNLVLSHCVGVGAPLAGEVVRAMLLCRAHTLSLGYSGIRLETLQLIYGMLNAGLHPRVPAQGSVGASGDLAPLAHMALAMLGRGDVEWRGAVVPASEALAGAGLAPVTLGPKEGVALSNGTSLMSALLSLALVDTLTLCDTADVVGAMTLEALQGVPAAFDQQIHAARPHSGQVQSAANIRKLTQDSTLLWGVPSTEYRVPSAHGTDQQELNGQENSVPGIRYSVLDAVRLGKVQDAYSLRCMPQVHGPARDAAAYVEGVLNIELNSANDNPLIFRADPDNDSVLSPQSSVLPASSVLSGGNFHGAPLSVASDFLGIAVCGLANISERRQARLVDKAAHGGLLPAFLTEHGGVNSGFMMVQYTAAALASENKSLAHPASVDTIPTSANAEDHVSMGPIAAHHARAIVANTARVLALEAMMAAQAIDFRLKADPHARMGIGTRAAYETIRAHIPFLERDDDMRPHIAAAENLVVSGALAKALATGTDTHTPQTVIT